MTRTLNKTMKAVVIDQFGGIETLKTREIPVPEVDADERKAERQRQEAGQQQDKSNIAHVSTTPSATSSRVRSFARRSPSDACKGVLRWTGYSFSRR